MSIMIGWSEIEPHIGNGQVVRYRKYEPTDTLTMEEVELVNPEQFGMTHWNRGRVRSRLTRTQTGALLWDSAEFLPSTAARRLSSRAVKCQKQMDEARAM